MNIQEAKPSLASATQSPKKGTILAVPSSPARTLNASICTLEKRHAMIAEAAYFMAKRRIFEAGHELEDWLFAESQIDAAITCGELPRQYEP